MRRRDGFRRGTRGQTLPLIAAICWLIALGALALATLGARAVSHARTQAAADATALAGAVVVDDAGVVADRNGVILESIHGDGVVEVVVASGAVSATAAAESLRPDWQGLRPELVAALARAEAQLGERIPIVSGFRTRAEQEALWANRADNPYPVAVPGTSHHELGLAVDVPLGFVPRLTAVATGAGLCQPLPVDDPVHFIPCGLQMPR